MEKTLVKNTLNIILLPFIKIRSALSNFSRVAINIVALVIIAVSIYQFLKGEEFIAFVLSIVCCFLLFNVGISSNFFSIGKQDTDISKNKQLEKLKRQIEQKEQEIDKLLSQKISINTNYLLTRKLTLFEVDCKITDFEEKSGNENFFLFFNLDYKYIGVLDYRFKANYGINLENVYVRETDEKLIIYGVKGSHQGLLEDNEDWKFCKIIIGDLIVIPAIGRFFSYKEKQREQLKKRIQTGQGQEEVEPILKAAEMSAIKMIELFLGSIAKNLGKEVEITQDEPPLDATNKFFDFINKIDPTSQNLNRIQSSEE